MSVAEFTGALQEQAYKQWFKLSEKNILAKTATEYRNEAQKTDRTSFFLDTETLIQLAEKLGGKELTKDQVDVLVGDLLGLIDAPKSHIIQEQILGGTKTVTGVFFRQIEFDRGINSVLQKSLKSIKAKTIVDKEGVTREARISDYFQKGHVFGVATNVTTQTARNLAKSKVTDASKAQLLGTLVSVRNKLLRQDLATANIKDIKFSLYSKYLKTPYKYLVEMQLIDENREAGGEAKLYTNALRRYFSPSNNAASITKDLKTRSSLGDKFIGKLINARGSPSFIELIGIELLNALDGKKRTTKYSVPSTKVTTVSKKIDTSAVRKATKTSLQQIDKAIKTVQSLEPEIAAPIQSPVNLLALLQSRISDQVKKNMGTGDSTSVLNYQTGRFAESVSIDRISTSRQGMISVFYNYMRNPYGTFSEGGAQQSPRSRDPKTLISKSIREIGTSAMYNRMRAVLI